MQVSTTGKTLCVGRNLDGRIQEFSIDCHGHEFQVREQRITALWDDSCREMEAEVWCPLALSIAEAIAAGEFPVNYPPSPFAIDDNDPAVAYAEMLNVERRRFPVAELMPAEPELYSRGISKLHEVRRLELNGIESSMRESGMLGAEERLSVEVTGADQQQTGQNTRDLKRPFVDENTFTIYFQGKSCFLGNTYPYRLCERLGRRPGIYIDATTLLDDIWNDDFEEVSVVRSAIKTLRQKLRKAGMNNIIIDGKRKGHFGMIVM